MLPDIPERLLWAVEMLSISPTDKVLEVGCGGGIATSIVADRLTTGRIVGIDRSAIQIERAVTRNHEHLGAGKAILLNVGLADYKPEERFDKVFAVNVNVFWLDPSRELEVVGGVLGAGGRLYLIWEPPSAAQVDRIATACSRHLHAAGFTVERTVTAKLRHNMGICIVGSPGGG